MHEIQVFFQAYKQSLIVVAEGRHKQRKSFDNKEILAQKRGFQGFRKR